MKTAPIGSGVPVSLLPYLPPAAEWPSDRRAWGEGARRHALQLAGDLNAPIDDGTFAFRNALRSLAERDIQSNASAAARWAALRLFRSAYSVYVSARFLGHDYTDRGDGQLVDAWSDFERELVALSDGGCLSGDVSPVAAAFCRLVLVARNTGAAL